LLIENPLYIKLGPGDGSKKAKMISDFVLALLFYNDGNFGDAGSKLTSLLSSTSTAVGDEKFTAYCHFLMGHVHLHQGKTLDALHEYDKAYALDKGYNQVQFKIKDESGEHLVTSPEELSDVLMDKPTSGGPEMDSHDERPENEKLRNVMTVKKLRDDSLAKLIRAQEIKDSLELAQKKEIEATRIPRACNNPPLVTTQLPKQAITSVLQFKDNNKIYTYYVTGDNYVVAFLNPLYHYQRLGRCLFSKSLEFDYRITCCNKAWTVNADKIKNAKGELVGVFKPYNGEDFVVCIPE
jgi:hypothetical protein